MDRPGGPGVVGSMWCMLWRVKEDVVTRAGCRTCSGKREAKGRISRDQGVIVVRVFLIDCSFWVVTVLYWPSRSPRLYVSGMQEVLCNECYLARRTTEMDSETGRGGVEIRRFMKA